MRILYAARGKQDFSLPKRWYHYLRDALEHRDQEGFFDASLEHAGTVTKASLARAFRLMKRERYDWIVANWKQQGFGSIEERVEAVTELFKNSSAHTAIFVSAAQAQYLPPEDVLDACDVIFKREPFRDRDRYDISDANKAKIVPTMIHCPFAYAPRDNLLAKIYHFFRPRITPCKNGEEKYEVGFSGADAAEHSLRRDVWERVLGEGFTTIGGLQPNPRTRLELPEKLRGPRYKGRAYRDALCAAKINLALDGIGEYTFRHQELLYLGKFILSGPSIRELELPMPLEEGVHYVAFDDLDDMVAKIRYYLEHDKEREQIARAGQKLFKEYYNPERHGKAIREALEQAS